ncbi:MAG: hypothetical protein QOE80_4485 [Actinomycetota bacterium]|jgi:hypothetical protein|nr:hypothetical protein [Actinomycetota bacterium]
MSPYHKEPQAMKRFIGLFVATIAASALPLSAAGASPAPKPADYQPGCEQGYQALKPGIDALVATPLKAVTNPLEKGFCGENKHS